MGKTKKLLGTPLYKKNQAVVPQKNTIFHYFSPSQTKVFTRDSDTSEQYEKENVKSKPVCYEDLKSDRKLNNNKEPNHSEEIKLLSRESIHESSVKHRHSKVRFKKTSKPIYTPNSKTLKTSRHKKTLAQNKCPQKNNYDSKHCINEPECDREEGKISTSLANEKEDQNHSVENHMPQRLPSKTGLPPDKEPITKPKEKVLLKIGGNQFKNAVYNVCDAHFSETYYKLVNEVVPECCDAGKCSEKHKTTPSEIATFRNGSLFNILDNSLTSWDYDIIHALHCTLKPELYLRGDVLRILFDYILNGPSEKLYYGIKSVLSCHLSVHPPCSQSLREFYLQLLTSAYPGESYFKTRLTSMGILHHILDLLDEHNDSPYVMVEDPEVVLKRASFIGRESQLEAYYRSMPPLTFQAVENRHNHCLPLFDIEKNEVVAALEKFTESTENEEEEGEEEEKEVKCSFQNVGRLFAAFELIVNLLVADLMICIRKLKEYIAGKEYNLTNFEPLIKNLMEHEGLQARIFALYKGTTDNNLLLQISRLVGAMAETVHLFKPVLQRRWQYPDLHCDCILYASSFADTLLHCNLSEEENLERLQLLSPPWLRFRVAMHYLNKQCHLQIGYDLKGLVDIIHMHVLRPDNIFGYGKCVTETPTKQMWSSTKKKPRINHYGENLLHILCKSKKNNKSELLKALAMPNMDVNARDNYGWTPLHEAVFSQSVERVNILLQYKPPPGQKSLEICVQNEDGWTPLHDAVHNRNLQICEMLLAAGGVPLLRKTDKRGITPLDLAETNAKEINEYFQTVIKDQELLNLNPNSVLDLSQHILLVLMTACDATVSDHHSLELYRVFKTPEKIPELINPKKCLVIDKELLTKFKEDQHQFSKLRKILKNLAQNSKNPIIVRLWDAKYEVVDTNHTLSKEVSIIANRAELSRQMFDELLSIQENRFKITKYKERDEKNLFNT